MAKNFLGSIPLFVAGALVTLLPKISLGAELTVCHGGCEHSTIQGAVNAAADGDTIFISGGTYSEHVTIQGKSLTIEGSGSNNTFVQGVVDGGPVFTLGTGSGPPYYEVDLSYLTVMGGEHVGGTQIGGGIQVRDGAYLHLSNATVTDNSANLGAGIGIMASVGPPSTLAQCSVTNNSGAVEGGGIYVQSGASLIVQQCSISNNTARGFGGGIRADGTLTMDGSTVSGNQVPGSPGFGGGISAIGGLTISDSVISGNSVTNPGGGAGGDGGAGGGIFVEGNVSIVQSVITQNSITGWPGSGGGIFASSASGQVLNLDTDYIVLNTVVGGGAGGLQTQGTGTLTLNDTHINHNASPNCSGTTSCPP